ncbi:TetR/AcrR family transcriptional regulator [Sciscionella sediminilitoris]|uniref:TetR/AcrR family transcriptional regulator n=1 Tax=Sciscionella sediminilitoris TaxID=1445613 RepID=UPI00068EF11C|nr:TetR/AcrR family transcriptional regulator [Sciscionella sp. SE31]
MYSPDDRTAKAVIRDTAIELIGRSGMESVSLKQIAEAAGVSQALIIKHYGSREGLVTAANEHVLGLMRDALEAVALGEPGAPLSAVLESLDSRYLARLLLSPGGHGQLMFAELAEYSRALIARLSEEGKIGEGIDTERLALILLAHDLSSVLLRDRITEALGEDPLGAGGLEHWMGIADALYRGRALEL